MVNLVDFRRFFEDKDRLIDRLDLSDEQKNEVKAFFKAHPNYENKIDWNRKNLTWKDFEKVLALEGKSNSSKKKYGLSGKAQIEDLEEGKDYEIIRQTEDYTIYYPLTFKGSEVLAKPTTPPEGVTGKWCIAGRNYSPGTRDGHWNNYTEDGQTDFFFIFTNEGGALGKSKWAMARSYEYPNESFLFDCDDHEAATFRCDAVDYCEESAKYLRQTIDFPKLISSYPFKLFERTHFVDEDGCVYTEDKTSLISIPYDIQSLIIPEGTESISCQSTVRSREDMQSDTPVTFPDLRYVSIPNTVMSLPRALFYNCKKMNYVHVGRGIGRVGQNTFYGCTGSISFAEGMTVLPRSAIEDSRFKSVHLPRTLYIIQPDAFYNCTELTKIDLPDGLKEIRSEAFHNTGLQEIKIPDSVAILGEFAFSNNSKLISIQLPAELFSISRGLFAGCKLLKTIEIPPKVTTIRDVAFTDCPNLKRLYIPKSVTYIDPYIFGPGNPHNPCNIEQVFFSGTKEQWASLMKQPQNGFWTWNSQNTEPRSAQEILKDKVIFTDDYWRPIGE